MRWRWPFLLVMLCLVVAVSAWAGASPIDTEGVRDALLEGVKRIHGGNQPGRMVVFGPRALAVADYAGGAGEGPVVAAALWGKGRVVALPDHQALAMDAFGEQGDSGRFYENALAWLAPGKGRQARILSTGHTAVAVWLGQHGYTHVSRVKKRRPDYGEALGKADVLVGWLGSEVADEDLAAIRSFVRKGGGLLLCDYGAGYRMWWQKPIPQAPGNRLLREVGIGFAGGYRQDRDLIDLVRSTRTTTVDEVLHVLARPRKAKRPAKASAAYFLRTLPDVLPEGDPLRTRLEKASRKRAVEIVPTPKTPVRDPLSKALLLAETVRLERTPVDDVVAHRSAEAVFGKIPRGAQRVRRKVTIDPRRSRWHATGLYAVPGEVVTVRVAKQVAGLGLVLQVSGHRDDIARRPAWRRMPRVARRVEIDATEVAVASPFGGALYVDVGSKPRATRSFDVEIEGAIEAPFFVLGETTDRQWRRVEVEKPAPYAELCSEHLCISLPSSAVRALDGPTDLMTFWDQVVALQDDLAGHGHVRTCASRINIDVQVSVGAAHSGYPVQGPKLWGLNDLEKLRREGSWGWFHELGHEAQRRPDTSWSYANAYTFDGSVEATVNLYSTYARDQLGIRDPKGWGWTSDPEQVAARAHAAVEKGGYDQVGVGDKLAMFLQLRDAFGWEAWKKVLRSYDRDQTEDPKRLPRTDAEKRDAFLVRFSRVVGHDLSRFLGKTWGLAFGKTALEEVAGLPPWMPEVGRPGRPGGR